MFFNQTYNQVFEAIHMVARIPSPETDSGIR